MQKMSSHRIPLYKVSKTKAAHGENELSDGNKNGHRWIGDVVTGVTEAFLLCCNSHCLSSHLTLSIFNQSSH